MNQMILGHALFFLLLKNFLNFSLNILQFGNPWGIAEFSLFLQASIQHTGNISHQWNLRPCILSNFRRIHVNVNQGLIIGNQVRLTDGTVRHSGSHHNDKIRMIHGLISVGLSVISHHAEEQGIIFLHYTKSHHGTNHRDIEFLGKCPNPLLGICQMHTAAHTENRTLCGRQSLEHLFNLHRISLYCGLIGPHLNLLRILELPKRSILYIDRNVNENRPLSSGHGNVEGFLENFRNFLYISYGIAVFDKGFTCTANIRFLENIGSQQGTLHLSCDYNQRNTVCKSCSNSRDNVGSTRS